METEFACVVDLLNSVDWFWENKVVLKNSDRSYDSKVCQAQLFDNSSLDTSWVVWALDFA